MRGIRVLAEARLDALEAAAFYESHADGLGAEFLDILEQALLSLVDTPRIGTPYDSDTRRLVLLRFPFALIYTVEAEVVVILAVAHQRRHPDYWRGRTP
ncbi:MAG: type II toxin-antitoxin system RelE/ParE family toxin [Longimicrobiales bacterium]